MSEQNSTPKEKMYMRLSGMTSSSTPIIKRLRSQEMSMSANICPKCESEIDSKDPSLSCCMCGSRFCLTCTKIPIEMYYEIEDGNIEGFAWHCRGCRASLPTLKSMDHTLKQIDERNESRFQSLEKKVDKLDKVITEKVTCEVKKLKIEVVEEIKTDMDQIIDKKIKEYEEQQLRASNVIVYNMPESSSLNSEIRRDYDIENFNKLLNDIEVGTVLIKTAYRLGLRTAGKNRPLKIVLENKQHRKSLLDNAKQIKNKSTDLKDVVIARDLTPKQREESKVLRAEVLTRRNLGEKVTIRQGKVVRINENYKKNTQPKINNHEQVQSAIQNAQNKPDEIRVSGASYENVTQIDANSPNMDISSITDETVIGGVPSQSNGAMGVGMPHA